MKTFVIVSECGELLDLAIHLKYTEKQDVYLCITDKDSKKIGDGIIEKIDDWHECIGKGYIFVFDGCNSGKTQDYLREQGELVFGGSEGGDNLENNRQEGMKLFIKAGFDEPESMNFKDIDSAIKYVQEHKEPLILKQNGDAPKGINHMSKDSKDMVRHLTDLKVKWTSEWGPIDFDLMEIVEGTEVAASAFFNGSDWMRNKEGKVVGFLNAEEKKETEHSQGATTGETGTTFLGVDEDNTLFADIILRPEIATYLKKIGFRGVFDVNGSLTKKGYVCFEPTCRFGVPATSYEFIDGLRTSTADLIESVAAGKDKRIEVSRNVGMVVVVAAKPFPIEGDLEAKDTSINEYIDIAKGSDPMKYPNSPIKLYNAFIDDKSGDLKVATKCGYILTLTAQGGTVEMARNKIVTFYDEMVFVSDMKIRKDIGKRVEEFVNKMA